MTELKATGRFINGQLVDAFGSKMRDVKVPILFDGVLPQLPGTIHIGFDIGVLTSSAPVTYKWRGKPWQVE